jgi:hypothetical protein
MNVTLDHQDVVTLYRHLREADRSLHFLMNPARSWDEFLAYYHPEKCKQAEQFFSRLMPQQFVDSPARQPKVVSYWRSWLSRLFSKTRRRWSFPLEELAWIIQQGRAFLRLLSNPRKPRADELVAQRQRLRDAQVLIEARCRSMSELTQAEAAAHFDQMPQSMPARVA